MQYSKMQQLITRVPTTHSDDLIDEMSLDWYYLGAFNTYFHFWSLSFVHDMLFTRHDMFAIISKKSKSQFNHD